MADYRNYAEEERADKAAAEFTRETGYTHTSYTKFGQVLCIRCGAFVAQYLVHSNKTGMELHDKFHNSVKNAASLNVIG